MTMLPSRRKFRYLFATRGKAMVIALTLVAALAFLGAGLTYANPATIDVPTESNQQTVEMSLSTHTTAAADTSMYDRGDRLEDQPVYLRNAAPTATLTAEAAVLDASEVELNQTVTLVYEARTRDGTMFWQNRERLSYSEAQIDQVTTEATLDIDEIANRHQSIAADLGDGGSAHVYILIETNYRTETYAGTMTERSDLSLRTDSYTIEPMDATETHGTSIAETRPDASSGIALGETLFLPHLTFVLGIVGSLAAGGAIVGHRFRHEVDPAVETAAIHYERYEEWISRGTLPSIDPQTAVVMETLADLVDVAIDTDGRVIYDSTQGCYAVVDGTSVYVFLEVTKRKQHGHSADSL